MARTEEAEWWTNAVYEAVQEIPKGKVTSYGHIAKLLGQPQRPRQVGVCLKHLPSNTDTSSGEPHHFHNGNVPWQRVVNSKGMISHSERGPGKASRQAGFLRQEGVQAESDAMGEWWVDLGEYGWYPDRLPSEGVTESSSGSESGSESEGERED